MATQANSDDLLVVMGFSPISKQLEDDMIFIDREFIKADHPHIEVDDQRISIEDVVRDYEDILLALPQSEWNLAIRDLYWIAVRELKGLSFNQLSKVTAKNAILFEADLSNLCLRTVDFSRSAFDYAKFNSTDLFRSQLQACRFQGANLDYVKANKANFTKANFEDASLIEAKLKGAILKNANLVGANLTRADLRETDCESADFSYANLEKADLEGANLFDIKFNALTKWPVSFKEKPTLEVDEMKVIYRNLTLEELVLETTEDTIKDFKWINENRLREMVMLIIRDILNSNKIFETRNTDVRFQKRKIVSRLLSYSAHLPNILRSRHPELTKNKVNHLIMSIVRKISIYRQDKKRGGGGTNKRKIRSSNKQRYSELLG